MEMSKQGKGTADHILPLGDWFAPFSLIGPMVLLISPERMKLESCACAQIKALEEENRWLCPDDNGDSS